MKTQTLRLTALFFVLSLNACGEGNLSSTENEDASFEAVDRTETAPQELLNLIPANATYAVIGQVTDGTSNRGISSVSVSTQNCATCSRASTTTNANGYYVFSTTTAEPTITPTAPAMASVFNSAKTGYKTRNIFSTPRYSSLPNGKKYHMVNFILYSSTAPDTDRDGIPNAYESTLNLNPTNADTDMDGVPDNWETFGYNWVDYKNIGGHATQKDLYVEVDYHLYYDNGEIVSGALSDAVKNKLAETYQSMPIDTILPNGNISTGIYPHFVHDQALPSTFDCFASTTTTAGEKSTNNPLLKDAFYKLTVCVGAQDDGDGRGAAQLVNQNLKILAPRTNSDSSDDETEFAQFNRYRLIMHEMGHALAGLKHGGTDNINYKPNYPSVMNYSYKWALNNSPETLAETNIGYSEGLIPDLDENNLVEEDAFANLTPDDVSFIRNYADKNYLIGYCPGTSYICADWNNNRTVDTAPYQQRLRINSSVQSTVVDFALLQDNDDFADFESNLGRPLPGNPNK